MRTIAHLSDLHFGRTDPAIVEALHADLAAFTPSLTIVSGDLTQRAFKDQYRQARRFLARATKPLLVIPGNHDVPLYNVIHRFFMPLKLYRRYVHPDLRPTFADEELLVLGINTTRRRFGAGGHVREEQLIDLKLRVRDAREDVLRIVVTHHPFIPAPGEAKADLVHGAAAAVDVFEDCGVDVVLSGHLHKTYTGDVRTRHTKAKRSILSIHAGTAASTRRRGEPNTYNQITTTGRDEVRIDVRTYDAGAFQTTASTTYRRTEEGWRKSE